MSYVNILHPIIGTALPANRPITFVAEIRIPLPPISLEYPVIVGKGIGDFPGIFEIYLEAIEVPDVAPTNFPLDLRIGRPETINPKATKSVTPNCSFAFLDNTDKYNSVADEQFAPL